MTSSANIDYVPLAVTVRDIKLIRRHLEAMKLLWQTQVHWIDVKQEYKFFQSLWYSDSYQI